MKKILKILSLFVLIFLGSCFSKNLENMQNSWFINTEVLVSNNKKLQEKFSQKNYSDWKINFVLLWDPIEDYYLNTPEELKSILSQIKDKNKEIQIYFRGENNFSEDETISFLEQFKNYKFQFESILLPEINEKILTSIYTLPWKALLISLGDVSDETEEIILNKKTTKFLLDLWFKFLDISAIKWRPIYLTNEKWEKVNVIYKDWVPKLFSDTLNFASKASQKDIEISKKRQDLFFKIKELWVIYDDENEKN